MKLNTLIKQLKRLQKKLGKNCNVVVDHDENGYYGLEKVKIKKDDDGKKIINLKSSNES